MPESLAQIRARYRCLVSAALLPATALALSIGTALVRGIPALAVVALCGAGVDLLGARPFGIGVAVVAGAVFFVGFVALLGVSIWSDAEQLWRGWIRGETFTPVYSQGLAFQRTLWSGVRGSDRLYGRRGSYRQLGLKSN